MQPKPTAEETLVQLGYYNSGTAFLSLNLLPAEWDVLQRTLMAAPLQPDSRIEAQLTAILSEWLEGHATQQKGVSVDDGQRDGAKRSDAAADGDVLPVLQRTG